MGDVVSNLGRPNFWAIVEKADLTFRFERRINLKACFLEIKYLRSILVVVLMLINNPVSFSFENFRSSNPLAPSIAYKYFKNLFLFIFN